MENVITEKRRGGQVKDDKWLVLTESTGKEGMGYKHKCGETILGKTRMRPVYPFSGIPGFELSGYGEMESFQVPFCPKCEELPE